MLFIFLLSLEVSTLLMEVQSWLGIHIPQYKGSPISGIRARDAIIMVSELGYLYYDDIDRG